MSDQLHLIPPTPMWSLDAATRRRGRRGVADARRVLEAARQAGGAHGQAEVALGNAA